MPSRLAPTEHWNSHFVRGLNGPYKAFWFWLQSACDHAGVWEIDIDHARMRTGFFDLELEEASKVFASKIVILECGEKWFMPCFVVDQYKSMQLNWFNTTHRGAIKILQKLFLIDLENNVLTEQLKGSSKPLYNSFKGVKDKDLDKNKDNIKEDSFITREEILEVEEIKINLKEPNKPKSIPMPKIEFELFWREYDKKVGDKGKIEVKWNALSKSDQDLILDHIPKYKASQPDKWFRKDPQTYLNNKGWLDEILEKPTEYKFKQQQGSKVENIINLASTVVCNPQQEQA